MGAPECVLNPDYPGTPFPGVSSSGQLAAGHCEQKQPSQVCLPLGPRAFPSSTGTSSLVYGHLYTWVPPPLPISARWASTLVGITGPCELCKQADLRLYPTQQRRTFLPGDQGTWMEPPPSVILVASCLHLGAWRTIRCFVFISRIDSEQRTWSWEGHASGQTLGKSRDTSSNLPSHTIAAPGDQSTGSAAPSVREEWKLPRVGEAVSSLS